MNNVFSYHRFSLMLRKDAADLRSNFIKILLISFGIGLFFFFMINYFKQIEAPDSGEFERMRFIIIWLTVVCNLLFAPFILYKRFNYRTNGVSHFMLPASQLEKWLSMFFYCLIATPLLSIAALTLADLCLLPFYPLSGTILWFLDGTLPLVFSHILAVNFFIYILSYQALFFFCNIWFQKSKVQKTFAVLIILAVFSAFFSALLTGLFPLPNFTDLAKVGVYTNDIHLATTMLRGIYNIGGAWSTVSLLLTIFTITGIWYASFLKWKEQEL